VEAAPRVAAAVCIWVLASADAIYGMTNQDSIREEGLRGRDVEQGPGVRQVAADVGAYGESGQNRDESGERG
jgi:hypothetical protein